MGAVRKLLAARVTVRTGHPNELSLLVEIERAAGETFRSLGMDLIADDDPGSVEELASYAEAGRALVAADLNDGRSGTCCSTSSTPPLTSSRSACVPTTRGKASAGMIERAASWARTSGLPALTLTTFIDVPWNGPYYERLGFRYLSSKDETPGLRTIRQRGERAASTHDYAPACAAASPPQNAR